MRMVFRWCFFIGHAYSFVVPTIQYYRTLWLSCEKWSMYYTLLSAMFNPLHSILNQELFEKHLCNSRIPKKRNGAVHPSYINYCLKSEVSIMLCCRLCSTHYTTVRIKNCLKSTSAIKIATIKIQTFSVTKGSHHVLLPNQHFSSTKMNGTQRRALVSPWRIHCLYCSMPKGTWHLLGRSSEQP